MSWTYGWLVPGGRGGGWGDRRARRPGPPAGAHLRGGAPARSSWALRRRSSTRIEAPTPAGGSYAIAYWYDGEGDPCPEAEAAGEEIIEYDAQGRELARTYVVLRPEEECGGASATRRPPALPVEPPADEES